MAVIYLSSVDGSDADDGSTWALAKATKAAALTAAGAGGTVYMDNAHAETQATAMTLTSPGTAASPTLILCVSRASGEPPTALATTGTVTTTGATAMSFAGFAYCYGVTFNCGTTGGSASINFMSASPWWWLFESCALNLLATGTVQQVVAGLGATSTSDDQLLELVNSTIGWGSATGTAKSIVLGCRFAWSGGSLTGVAITTPLFTSSTSASWGHASIVGVDLSLLASSKTLVNIAGTNQTAVFFRNCKLGSSVAITTGSVVGQGGMTVELVNCDSGDTNYRYYLQDYRGTIQQETTIVRTGGASDGTTPVSSKMVTTANSKFISPCYGPWFKFWNDTTGSPITVPIEVVTDNVTLTDADAGVQVECFGTSGFPQVTFSDDLASDVLATPANQTTSSETWTTTGLATPVKQVLSTDVTPQEKGWIRARVVLARPSTTLYACPKIKSDSAVQYMDSEGDVVNAPAAGGASGGFVFGG